MQTGTPSASVKQIAVISDSLKANQLSVQHSVLTPSEH